MPKQVFNLRNVPDDEAAEVRALLEENGIEFYETDPGNWGISAGGLWLRDERRFREARALIDEYEQQRQQRVRAEYQRLRREGRQRSLMDLIREDPLRFLLYLAGIIALLYISIKPFLHFGK